MPFYTMTIIKYRNTKLQIGLTDWKNVYQFPQQELMKKEIHQGKLYYRLKGSSKRISYNSIKKDLVKREIIIEDDFPF